MGVDIWNAYEVSWLGKRAKPELAIAKIQVPANSPAIFESKSLKLYLNSLNYLQVGSIAEVQALITKDLSSVAQAPVQVQLMSPDDWRHIRLSQPMGTCLDRLDLEINPSNTPNLLWLSADFQSAPVAEVLFSNLLRSNCPVTGQPDWATIFIDYAGPQIAQEGLLRYLISFRHHQEFHEHCVEKIFCEITAQCRPSKLTVYARYTRRGGVDINPFRTNSSGPWPENHRLPRQ
jgi:7-cyano-7-deazaguanine reductase